MCFLSWFTCSCNRGVCMHGACMPAYLMHAFFDGTRLLWVAFICYTLQPVMGLRGPFGINANDTFGSLAPPAGSQPSSTIVCLNTKAAAVSVKTATISSLVAARDRQILWFVMYVVSTLYTFTWDVLQDWGLGYPVYGFLRKKRLFARSSVSVPRTVVQAKQSDALDLFVSCDVCVLLCCFDSRNHILDWV